MALTITLGVLFAARASWGFLSDRDLQWLFPLVFGVLLIVLSLPSLVSGDVMIADGKLTGPASVIGPLTWYSRNTIQLDDLTRTGVAPYGYTYFESTDGRRVYIANSYRGAPELIDRINSFRSAGNAGG